MYISTQYMRIFCVQCLPATDINLLNGDIEIILFCYVKSDMEDEEETYNIM